MFDIYSSLKALAIIVSIFAIANVISIRSKGSLSIMFVATILFVTAFINGLSKDIFDTAQLYKIGKVLVTAMIVHLGTTLNIDSLKQQWKVVLIAISAELGIIFSIITFGLPFFDIPTTLSSISPIGGGIVATVIVQKSAELHNLNTIILYTSLLLSSSGFVGYPIASYFLKKEAKIILQNSDKQTNKTENHDTKKRLFHFPMIQKFTTTYTSTTIILGKIILVAFLSFFIAKHSHGYINEYILCLILGFLFKEIGILEFDSLNKANAFGFNLIAVFTVVFHSFTSISMEILLQLILPILYFLTLGLVGMISTSLIVGKKLKFSKNLSISVGIACMFGFPGTFIIPNEVSKSVGKTKEEQELILERIYPQMLIAGFVNVTVASVLISGLIVRFF